MRPSLRWLSITGLVAGVLAAGSADRTEAAQTTPAPPSATRVVNVTPDSAKGWLPSVELEQEAREAALAILAADDAGRAEDAYGRRTPLQRQQEPLPDFARRLAAFNVKAGAVVERRIVATTWTKDPAQAPEPGIYVAYDLVSRYANIDRDCGYIVMRRTPSGGPFLLAREETNVLDNATAKVIEAKSGLGGVEAAWSTLSSHCAMEAQAGGRARAVAGKHPVDRLSDRGRRA